MCESLLSPSILPYHISVSNWTPKKAAIIGILFSGTSVVFLSALVVAMNWQHGRSPGQKDWGIVFAAAFGVPFVCCSAAAVVSQSVTHWVQTVLRMAADFAPRSDLRLRTIPTKSATPRYRYIRWIRGADRICAVRPCGTVLRRHSYNACCVRCCRWGAVTNEDSAERCHPLRRYICGNRRRNNRICGVQALRATTDLVCFVLGYRPDL